MIRTLGAVMQWNMIKMSSVQGIHESSCMEFNDLWLCLCMKVINVSLKRNELVKEGKMRRLFEFLTDFLVPACFCLPHSVLFAAM